MNIAIILAAGSSSRFNFSTPKQYCYLNDKLVIEYSIEAFKIYSSITKIVLVVAKKHYKYYHKLQEKYNLDIVIGGNSRQLSVKNALNFIKKHTADKIIIHDAARPFINKQIIDRAFNAIKNNIAAIPVIEIYDSVRNISSDTNKTLDRRKIFKVQTPQIFAFNTLLECHNMAKSYDYSDDASLVEEFGHKINIFTGCKNNLKITNYNDLSISINNMKKSFQYKIGNGFDVHKFSNDLNDTFILLGGVKIEHDRHIIAHSDGDVLIHSLVDAMLGAIGAGDIGDHFPPSDDKYKDMNSDFFLNKATESLVTQNAKISNIDITILCEQPKLSKYKEQIKSNLACILQINSNIINVKATTTEKLGFLGRGEGIAVSTSILIKQYE